MFFYHYFLERLADWFSTSSNQEIISLIVCVMLFGWVSYMFVFIIWKLEWMKILLKLNSKREVVPAILKYKCFDYFFQILFGNITVWILLSILTLLSAFNISVNTYHPEITTATA